MKGWKVLALVAAAVLIGTVPMEAGAVATLNLVDGYGNFVTVEDQSADDINTMVGVITFSGALGTAPDPWIVNVTTGITKPVLGSATLPWMDLNSVNVSSASAGTLNIYFYDTDFNNTTSGFDLVGAIGGTTSGTVEYLYGYDPDNIFFGNLVNVLGPFGPGAFSGTGSDFIDPPSPYALTQQVLITHNAAGVTSFDAELKGSVPEPGTMMLLGSGLIGLAGWGRKKFRK